MASRCVRGGSVWISGKICVYGQSGQALELAAQGGGGVTVPGGVQKSGTSGHGLVGVVVLGGWLDSVILEVCSNL